MIQQEQIEAFSRQIEEIQTEIGKEIIGQKNVIEQLLTALVAGGNVLLEGVPGLGKTRLVRTLSQVFDMPFNRIQFTPDLMPADITGTNIIVKTDSGNEFRFREGPLFASIVLADEINRATPKTQAALLEAMQEHSVTVAGETHQLSEPYFVLATQNPMEQEGTYPLPEAQLDRFMLKIQVDFPSLEELGQIVGLTTRPQTRHAQTVANADTLLQMRAVAQDVPIAQAVQDFALRLVLATHPELQDSPELVRRWLPGFAELGLDSIRAVRDIIGPLKQNRPEVYWGFWGQYLLQSRYQLPVLEGKPCLRVILVQEKEEHTHA